MSVTIRKPNFINIPLDVLREICELVSWNDLLSLARTCCHLWDKIKALRTAKKFLMNDQKLIRFKKINTLHKCLLSKICTSIIFSNMECDIGLLYVIFKSFPHIQAINLSTVHCTQINRTSIIQILNKLLPNCIIKVNCRTFESWYNIIEPMKRNTVVIAKVAEVMLKDSEAVDLENTNYGLNFYETPPQIQRHIEFIKDEMKQHLLSYGGLKLRNKQLAFAPQLLKLTAGQKYSKITRVFDDKFPNQALEIEKAVLTIGKKFMECVITSGDNWILLTQFDVFLSNSILDNCAYPVKSIDLDNIEVRIKEKQEGRAIWQELIIQNGPYQILAIAGVTGNSTPSNCKPFLGSSFPHTTSYLKDHPICYVLCNPASTRQIYRYLRDYSKKDARLEIGYTSTKFESLGFSAAHPLSYHRTSNIATLSIIGSHILSSYMSRKTTKEEVEEYFSFLKKNKFISSLIKEDSVSTVEELYEKYEEDIKKSSTMTRVVIEKLYLMEEAVKCRSPINMQLVDNDEQPKLRDIVKNGLGEAIKKANKERMKKFAAAHL